MDKKNGKTGCNTGVSIQNGKVDTQSQADLQDNWTLSNFHFFFFRICNNRDPQNII